MTDLKLQEARNEVSCLESNVFKLKEKISDIEKNGAEVMSGPEKQIDQEYFKVVNVEQTMEQQDEEYC